MKDPENPTDDMISDMDIKVHPSSANVVVGGLIVYMLIMAVSIASGVNKHRCLSIRRGLLSSCSRHNELQQKSKRFDLRIFISGNTQTAHNSFMMILKSKRLDLC